MDVCIESWEWEMHGDGVLVDWRFEAWERTDVRREGCLNWAKEDVNLE